MYDHVYIKGIYSIEIIQDMMLFSYCHFQVVQIHCPVSNLYTDLSFIIIIIIIVRWRNICLSVSSMTIFLFFIIFLVLFIFSIVFSVSRFFFLFHFFLLRFPWESLSMMKCARQTTVSGFKLSNKIFNAWMKFYKFVCVKISKYSHLYS